MEIIYKNINDIKEYKNNPRKNNEAVGAVAESIKEFGFKVPIIIDKNSVIVAGHTRKKAAEELGLTEVPCIIADDLTPQQIKAFRLADNKVAEKAEWDFELLDVELEDIEMDMSGFGFDLEVEPIELEAVEDNYDFSESVEPRTKPGDVWQLGRHRLMCGDATDINAVKTLVGGVLIDLVITDPPYNVAIVGGTEEELTIKNDDMQDDEFIDFLRESFACMAAVLKEGGVFYVWHASRTQKDFEIALNDNGLVVREQLIWNKNTLVLGRQDYQWKHEPCFYGWKDGASHNWYSDRRQTTVFDFDRPTRSREHPTMKPVELFDYQIKNSSKQGDAVLDLFGGSGTTTIACEQNGRDAFLMELDPYYCDVIIDRWETFTGEKAVKLD